MQKFFNEEMDDKKGPDGEEVLSTVMKKSPSANSQQAADCKPTKNHTFKAEPNAVICPGRHFQAKSESYRIRTRRSNYVILTDGTK
jgi:hypothetical protein